MKKLFTIISATLLGSTLYAQDLFVHQNDGTAVGFNAKDVDEINFELGKSKLAAPDADCEKKFNNPETLLDAISRIIEDKDDRIKGLIDSLSYFRTDLYKKNQEIESLKKELENCNGGAVACDDQHEAVDLGLSVKWASMNLGATTPTEPGNHYSWGEVDPIDDTYDFDGWSASKLKSEGIVTKDSLLAPEHDAATVNWGECWRMPSGKEVNELYEKCKWEVANVDGMRGYKVTGPNGNSIYMPAVGIKKKPTDTASYGDGYYWSSQFSPVNDEYANSYVMFQSENRFTIHGKHTRHDGCVIRAVSAK